MAQCWIQCIFQQKSQQLIRIIGNSANPSKNRKQLNKNTGTISLKNILFNLIINLMIILISLMLFSLFMCINVIYAKLFPKISSKINEFHSKKQYF